MTFIVPMHRDKPNIRNKKSLKKSLTKKCCSKIDVEDLRFGTR